MPAFEKFKKKEVILAVVQIVIPLLISLNCAYIFSYRWNYRYLKFSTPIVTKFDFTIPLWQTNTYWNNWITDTSHQSKRVPRYDPGPRSTAYKQTWLYTAYPSLATIPLLISNALVLIHRYKQLSKSSFNWSKTFTIYFTPQAFISCCPWCCNWNILHWSVYLHLQPGLYLLLHGLLHQHHFAPPRRQHRRRAASCSLQRSFPVCQERLQARACESSSKC